MSGLNSVEMSASLGSRRSHAYRSATGPDGDEPARTRRAEGDAGSDRGEADPGRGGATAAAQRAAGAAAAAEVGERRRRDHRPRAARAAVEQRLRRGVPTPGAAGVPAWLSGFRSDAGEREARRGGTRGRSGDAAAPDVDSRLVGTTTTPGPAPQSA